MPIQLSRVFILAALALAAIWLFVVRSLTSGHTTQPGPSPRHPPDGRSAFPEGATYTHKLVAVGDLHGDIVNAKKVLRMAGVIDEHDKWSGNVDTFVQTGDIVDRGAYAIDIYKMMQRLRGEARGKHQRLISVMGNHEMMNALSDWRYVTEADMKQWGGSEKRRNDMSVNGWLGQEWLANYSVTALVALGPHKSSPKLSFTHGSLRPSYPNLTPYPDAINALGHSLLKRTLTPPLAPPYPPAPYRGLPPGTTREEAELYASGGPLWWRGLAEVNDERVVCKWAKELQSKLGVRRIIGGHTPNFEHMVWKCNASIIIIDTGISYAYGGRPSALEVYYSLTPVDREDLFVGESVGSESESESESDSGLESDLGLGLDSALDSDLDSDSDSDSASASDHDLHTEAHSHQTHFHAATTPLKAGKYIETEEVYAVYEDSSVMLARHVRPVVL